MKPCSNLSKPRKHPYAMSLVVFELVYLSYLLCLVMDIPYDIMKEIVQTKVIHFLITLKVYEPCC
jgi:hypothetical protein